MSNHTTTNHANSSARPPRPASGTPANRNAPDPPLSTLNWVAQPKAGPACAPIPPTESCQSPPGAIAAYTVPDSTGPKKPSEPLGPRSALRQPARSPRAGRATPAAGPFVATVPAIAPARREARSGSAAVLEKTTNPSPPGI